MKRQPLVSIITPCYNGETFLDRYFQSVLNQTYNNLELIFINDGSIDKTEKIALSYREKLECKGIRYTYEFQENQGQAAALNRGLKLFTGEYLTWPDSDDEMFATCIQRKVDFLENHKEYGFCACKIMVVDENDPTVTLSIMENNSNNKEQMFQDFLNIKGVFNPLAYMVRSANLLDVLPERDIYSGRGGQNIQLLLPLSHKYECGLIDEILGKYFVRQDSHSHSQVNYVQILQQLKNYETIVMETLIRMSPEIYQNYSLKLQQFYGHLRYGNAIDSEDKNLIKREYANIKRLKSVSMKDRLLYIKKMI